MDSIRTKFECESKCEDKHGSHTIKLAPVFATSEENKAFWEATPNGEISMTTTKPEAAAMFVPGREYYVEFTPASDQNARARSSE